MIDARWMAATLLLGIAACGGSGGDAGAGEASSGSAEAAATAGGEEEAAAAPEVLTALPEACSVIGAAEVEDIVGEAVSGNQVLHSPKQRSVCRFSTAEGDELTVQLLFLLHDAYDPSVDSPDKLRAQVTRSSGEPSGELNGTGYHGFYVESSDGTGAHVVTEFQGTAMVSDRPVSQLHMTVELRTDAEPADRLDAVRRTVEGVIARI